MFQVIKKLETSNLIIIESLAEVENAANKLNVQGESGVTIKNKVNYVFAKNVGLQHLKTNRDIFLNKNENTLLDIEFTPSDL